MLGERKYSSILCLPVERLFLAPRSNETSHNSLISTIKNGIPYERVHPYLSVDTRKILSAFSLVFAWGNQESLKSRWEKMKEDDFVLFYAEGCFVYSGRVLCKQFSAELSDCLWPRSPRFENRPWACVFFLHEFRSVNIPLNVINELGGYKFKAIQGFQVVNDGCHHEIVTKYGSLDSFISAYETGVTSRSAAVIDRITSKEVDDIAGAAGLDSIVRTESDLEEVIAGYTARNLDRAPEVVEKTITRIKRNYGLVRALKERFNFKCQICGFTFKTKSGEFYAEAAHIKPISSLEVGVDTPGNILVLCANHHKMLDHGAIEFVSIDEVRIEGMTTKLGRFT